METLIVGVDVSKGVFLGHRPRQQRNTLFH